MKVKDLTNQKFGKLTAIKSISKTKSGSYIWLCKCDCGNSINVSQSNLNRLHTKSCGCLKLEIIHRKGINAKHSMTGTRLYHIWQSMKRRCYGKEEIKVKNYSNRNIIVCDEWKNNFQKFYEWAMANGYNDNLSIDRIDNNGNYCPENCRWANAIQQANNRRNNKYYENNGEIHTIREWCEILGININTAKNRARNTNDFNKIFYKGDLISGRNQ